MYGISLRLRLTAEIPSNHPSLVRTYNNIAQTYQAQGDPAQALEYLEKTLEIKVNSLPPKHGDFAITYNNLALALNDQGRYEEALKYMKMAYEIDILNLSADDPDVIEDLKFIADLEKQIAETTVKTDE
ncbi:unnamed protein product [Didymodactylos carnosus]|nr:unnamed protein product [Didymodactylos carnosus]CAF4623478.1 unnamed protein product [Didymodactylos carnosus]